MKVAVIGSCDQENQTQLYTFKAVCREIGRVLTKEGHTLLVAHSAEHTAEFSVKLHCTEVENVKESHYWSTKHIEAVKEAHAVVVIGGAEGSTVAGLFARSEQKPFFPISLAGGAGQDFWSHLDFPSETESVLREINNNIQPNSAGWAARFRASLTSLLRRLPRIFIIHGRSSDREDLAGLLKKRGVEAIALDTAAGAGILANKFDRNAKNVDGAIAILTPDDVGAAAIDDSGHDITVSQLQLRNRARQNVWVEVGWIWGRFSLEKLRVLVPKNADIEMPSDLHGLRLHHYQRSPTECTDKIMEFCQGLTT